MRVINLIVVHCSATKADRDFTEQDLEVCHRRRGMNGPGYHFYIRKNGDIKTTRPIEKIGAHARGHNAQSIGICYEGGISERGRLADTRTVGQKMQTKAAPIREGVIVIKQETTMQELQQFAAVCKERFGIEAFQIHIHKDEGYMNAKQWTPNLHAHVVFDWTQPNGKSVRLSRDDMAELQTIASEALGMERGVSSDRKHLSAMQYKTECAKEQLQELSNDISSALDKHKDVQNQLLQLQKELRSIETKKNVQKLISKASEKFYGLIGKTVNDREKDALKAKIKALEGENEQLSDRLGKAILEKERNGTKVFKAENDKEYYRQQMDNARTTSNRLRTENQELKTETKELKKELGKMKDLFNSEQLEALRHHFPNISKAMEEGKDLLKQITRSRGFGMGM